MDTTISLALLLLVNFPGCIPQEFVVEKHKPYIAEPVLPERPFVAVWNINSGKCGSEYGVNVDLSSFDIVNNPNETSDGDNMVIFYRMQMGLYPFIDTDGTPVNGGIPQLGDIGAHYKKCVEDIEAFIPQKDFSGIAVIDWENWKPIWHHNGFGHGLIYQNASINKVRKEHPNWNATQVAIQAEKEFEVAGKNFMLGTLAMAELMRPKAKWGYYLFPDCWNYAKIGSDYSCSDKTVDFNNQLQWLFDKSTGLYPSTYVGLWFKNSNNTVLYAGNRIREALRVDANRQSDVAIPIYGYNNLVYRQTREFLTKKDVVHSSGIAAALGASGVVLWGHKMQVSKAWCQKLKEYVEHVLGPYLKMASDTAAVCSIEMCSGHGRCVLSNEESDFSRRPPKLFAYFIEYAIPGYGNYTYKCQCYDGFTGTHCQKFNQLP